MNRGRINKKKEITKIRLKKTKNLITNRRVKERGPDLWKELYSGLKVLGKKYKNFREKQKIKKQKEEQIRLKKQEEQRLQEQEERKLQKEQKLKEAKERRLKEREEKRLEEKRIKEAQQKRERQEQIYKERVAKADRERLKQLEKVSQLRQEEKQLKEERKLLIGEKKLKKESRLEEEQIRLKEQEEQRPKEEGKRLNGKVKWFNGAKGYGFIEREGEEKDIFVHFSAVKKSGLKYLEKGEQLTFEIENSEKGPSATNLQKVINLQQAPIPFLKLVKKN